MAHTFRTVREWCISITWKLNHWHFAFDFQTLSSICIQLREKFSLFQRSRLNGANTWNWLIEIRAKRLSKLIKLNSWYLLVDFKLSQTKVVGTGRNSLRLPDLIRNKTGVSFKSNLTFFFVLRFFFVHFSACILFIDFVSLLSHFYSLFCRHLMYLDKNRTHLIILRTFKGHKQTRTHAHLDFNSDDNQKYWENGKWNWSDWFIAHILKRNDFEFLAIHFVNWVEQFLGETSSARLTTAKNCQFTTANKMVWPFGDWLFVDKVRTNFKPNWLSLDTRATKWNEIEEREGKRVSNADKWI